MSQSDGFAIWLERFPRLDVFRAFDGESWLVLYTGGSGLLALFLQSSATFLLK
jgi:hypothetical protein